MASLFVASTAMAADVEVSNRTSVDCRLEATGFKLDIAGKTTVNATVPDEAGGSLKAVCTGSGLDVDERPCKMIIGGAGGSGNTADSQYPFRMVKKIHIFPNMGQWLVCSAL